MIQYGSKITIICYHCANEFTLSAGEYRLKKKRSKSGKLYCSQKCSNYKNGMTNNTNHIKARHAINHAIRDGKVKKLPCEICGNLNVEAHHKDYSKYLDVIWLCRKHHCELHSKERENDI